MRRLIVLLLVLVNFAQLSPVNAQDAPYHLTVANWDFNVDAAVKAPFFMDAIHLGTLDDGRDWLVVTMTATNTSGEKQELHSDKIQLRSDGEMIKQTGDESEGVADELGAKSIGGSFPHDIEAGAPFQIVQVFKVSPEATSNTLVFDFSGNWEIPLDDLLAASNGNSNALTGGESATAAHGPWTIETASYRLDLIGTAVAPTFSGPFHLGSPDPGNVWLVVTYKLTSLRNEVTEVKADNHRLLIGSDELKQSTDETKTVSSELGISMLTMDLRPNEPADVVQVFKVPASANAYTFQLSARGKLFLNLTPVVAATSGDGAAIVPGEAIDLAQVNIEGETINLAPTEVPLPTSAPTNTPLPTDVPKPSEAVSIVEPTLATADAPDETPAAATSEESDVPTVDPAELLAGRLGGTLTDTQLRFGEPSWTDADLIGYNSVTLAGTDAILVVYYDPDETVSKLSIVYRERPAGLDSTAAVSSVVSEIAPLDGTCRNAATSGSLSCASDALATVFDATYLRENGLDGKAGSYHFTIDPNADEYFEIVVEPGDMSRSALAQTPIVAAPTSDESNDSTAEVSAEELVYAAEIVQQTQTMSDSLARMAALTEGADVSLFLDDDWKLAVAVELVIWQQTYEDALAMTPPPRFAAAHAKYLESLSYFVQAGDAFAYGVDNFDVASIEQAAALMELGTQALAEAAEEIRAVTGQDA